MSGGSSPPYPPYYADDGVTLYRGDALEVLRELPAESVNCVVTSPPYYGLRDYGEAGQYGLEPTPAEYVERMREVFAEVRRVLTTDGTCWLNIGDTYAGKANAGASVGRTHRADRAEVIPPRVNMTGTAPYKSLLLVPERLAIALVDDGWTVRNGVRWHKPNAMPDARTDRLSVTHETVWFLVKSPTYWFDLDAIREPHSEHTLRYYGPGTDARQRPNDAAANEENTSQGVRRQHQLTSVNGRGRNPGDVWSIPTQPFPGAHFAAFPPRLVERCIRAGCRPGGTVLDLFCGSGTTGMVANRLGHRFVGIDLSAKYLDLALRTRLAQGALMTEEVACGT